MVLQEQIDWQTHIFFVKGSIKSLNNRSFKFVKMRSRERHQKPVACSSSLGGHFASCLEILFSSLVRKKEYLVYVSKFYDCNKNLERATQRKTDISGLIFHLNNIFSFIFHNNQFPFPPLLPSPPLSHVLPSP